MSLRLLEVERKHLLGILVLLLLVLGLPALVGNAFYLNLMVLVFIYAGAATAWNILGGMTGQFSLGHTVFFGIGAYTSTLLYNFYGISPWIGGLIGGVISMSLALAISYPIFRLRGVFFAMATLAVSETVRILVIYARREFDLPYGLSINYEPSLANMIFASRESYVYLAGGFLLLVMAVAFVLDRSYVGYYLRAIRDNQEAAEAAGISVRRYKLLGLLVSTFLTSLGGTILAQYTLYIEPETVFNVTISINMALMSILGGLGTLLGPLVGAVIALPLQEFLRDWLGSAASGAHLAVYGVLLVAMVIGMPKGIVGTVGDLLARRRGRLLRAARERAP